MKKLVVTFIIFTIAFSTGQAIGQSKEWAAKLFQSSLLEAKTPQETRETLDPRLFANQKHVAMAYQAAKDIPKVLDKIYCYCHCEMNPKFKHKSLLSCYADTHAKYCGICMRQAVGTKKMSEEGKSAKEIAKIFSDYYLDRKH